MNKTEEYVVANAAGFYSVVAWPLTVVWMGLVTVCVGPIVWYIYATKRAYQQVFGSKTKRTFDRTFD